MEAMTTVRAVSGGDESTSESLPAERRLTEPAIIPSGLQAESEQLDATSLQPEFTFGAVDVDGESCGTAGQGSLMGWLHNPARQWTSGTSHGPGFCHLLWFR